MAPNEHSNIDIKPDERSGVILQLLEINRVEIRQWQQTLFEVSLWFNGGIIAFAAFVQAKDFSGSTPVRILIGLSVACLGLFYFVFSGVARSAIDLSGNDLLKLQGALRLDEDGYYIPNAPIYDRTGIWLPQQHVTALRALNVAVCALAIASLWF